MMVTGERTFSLEQYKEEGYSGPIQVVTPAEAQTAYDRFFEVIGQSKEEPGATQVDLGGWHQTHPWAYSLATHPNIVGPMTQILGEDVVLWAMRFWYKEPGNSQFIPWHQDIAFWPMEPAINATAWMTLGHSNRHNGGLRIIPGTHKQRYDHLDLDTDEARLGKAVNPKDLDESKMLELEMTPGEAVFFSESLFHSSEKNLSSIPRVAFSLRFTTPEVKFKGDEWEGLQVRTLMVHGEDRYHLNDNLKGTVPTG